MPIIRSGHGRTARSGFLIVFFSTFLAIGMFVSGGDSAEEVKQIKLTEKHMQNFIAVSDELAKYSDAADIDKLDAELEAIARRNGFASLAEFTEVGTNISMIMSGIDQQTRKFTEPVDQIKQQIVVLKSDKSVPERQKKEDLAQLEAALKDTKPIQFKDNIALVLGHFDKLMQFMQEQGPAD